MAIGLILVADDDPTTRSVIAAGLQQDGYRVITAMDAMQTVRAAHKELPAAIVLDIMMPAGSGLDVLKKIKASSATQLIPVVAMSSMTDPKLPDQARALGANEFLPKPVDLPRLCDTLRRLLNPGPPGQPPAS